MFRKLANNLSVKTEEDFKWGVPVFKYNEKVLFAMSGFKEHTKYNFFTGATLDDPDGLFNNGLDSKKHRSIDLREGEKINEGKLTTLMESAL